MTAQTGTLFLTDLDRRARGDARIHLVSTVFLAGLAGLIGNLRLDEWGFFSFGDSAGALWSALGTAALWLGLALAISHFAGTAYRDYIAGVMTDTGLLYLVLEHDPHEVLKPLTQRETWATLRLKPGQDGLSFRGRMLLMLKTYPACVASLGFHPYPQLLRWTARIMDYVLIALTATFACVIYRSVSDALAAIPPALPLLKVLAWSLLALILVRATLGITRRTALWLALVDVFVGDIDRGKAILAGGM
ncbi:hypothetical protein JW859_05595 [bacterium]|nr:hypothetical protein [bacterium]